MSNEQTQQPPSPPAPCSPDTVRLNWLLKMGYTPAKWRPWVLGDPPTRNGMVYLGKGTRDEIDAAMQRQANAGGTGVTTNGRNVP